MSAAKSTSLALVCGDDDFAVKQRAKQLFQEWSAELGGMDHETIEATVSNGGDALTAIGKLREALNTLPFFGGGKVVWLCDCNFLGEDRTASSAAVTETLARAKATIVVDNAKDLAKAVGRLLDDPVERAARAAAAAGIAADNRAVLDAVLERIAPWLDRLSPHAAARA